MKFLLLSDLHLEFHPLDFPNGIPACDAILLAGDIGVAEQPIHWAKEKLAYFGVPVLFVPGNHEYYSHQHSMEQLHHWYKENSAPIEFVQNRVREFPDHKTVVISATLWTDYKVYGQQDMNLIIAERCVNDYRFSNYKLGMPLKPVHCLAENQNSIAIIQAFIKYYQDMDWKIVVMTHHAPTEQSCSEQYMGQHSNICFVNTFDRDPTFLWPDVWVHGHVHNPVDHMIGDCRVLANPRGYVSHTRGVENPHFNPDFTFEI